MNGRNWNGVELNVIYKQKKRKTVRSVHHQLRLGFQLAG
jgi:hypothetical protein